MAERCSNKLMVAFLKQSEEKLYTGSDLPGLSLPVASFRRSGVILRTASKCELFTADLTLSCTEFN